MAARSGLFLGVALLALSRICFGVESSAAQVTQTPEMLLRRAAGFSAADMRLLDTGVAVVRSLNTPVRQEFAHVAAVHINASYQQFLERFRDIEKFERGPGVPQIGRFGTPPQLADLASLMLPADDVKALAACSPGSCDVQLPEAAIRRFQKVNWSSPNASRDAHAILNSTLLDLVRAYQVQGNAALGQYNDGGEPMAVADQFRALLASSDRLPIPVPELLAFLNEYPRRRPPGVEDFLYWTIVDFGLKPTVRVNHVAVYPLAPPSPAAYAIAIKQLYATHYFHSTLELRFLLDDTRPGRDGFWLLSLTRSRNDGTTGFAGLLIRPIISRRSRDAVRGYLEHVKRQVERPDL